MSDEQTVVTAVFITDAGNGEEIPVHFNPVSLQYAITNTLQEQGQDKKQYVTKSTAKLTMDLVFDTTDDGSDVRVHTMKVARLMEPAAAEDDPTKNIPSIVVFDWGTFRFKGMVESYRETLDFFAPTGVPLRASVNMTLARQERVFESDPDARTAPPPEPVVPLRPEGESMTDVARRAGDPRAGRALARANGEESMRMPVGATVAVSGGVRLGGPAGLAGASGGVGIGITAGGGVGLNAGIGAGGGGKGFRLDAERLLQRDTSRNLATDRGASFALGGAATVEGAASLSADVGVGRGLKDLIRFEE